MNSSVTLTWLNKSITTLNTILQFLNIIKRSSQNYIYIYSKKKKKRKKMSNLLSDSSYNRNSLLQVKYKIKEISTLSILMDHRPIIFPQYF